MGFGDFKLLAATGAWLGIKMLLPIVLAASLIGAVVGVAMKMSASLREGRYVPFGPFLAGAALVVMLAGPVHRVRDPHEMLDELEGDLLVGRVVLAQNQRHLEHALAVERHPGGPVRLFQRAAVGQWLGAIEDTDIVQPEKAAGE